jgi:hypothetical protein
MYIEELEPEALWRYYQRGYYCLVRSGRFFRAVMRPALSHVYFQRAVPLLIEYSRANHGSDLPPGFGDQMDACPLTARDLLHLDYAISLGYAEELGHNPMRLAGLPVLEWPGPDSFGGVFVAADVMLARQLEALLEEDARNEESDSDEEDNPSSPFDL